LEVKLDEEKLGNIKKMTREQLISKLKNRIQKNEELIKNDSTVLMKNIYLKKNTKRNLKKIRKKKKL
jgi:hypothetical protein